MLNTNYLNSILKELNLHIERTDNGEYIISNYTDNITDLLSRKEGFYEYSFTKDDINYLLKITNKSLTITNDLRETIILDNNGFEYYQREPKKEQNLAFVSIQKNILSFYQNKQNKDHPNERYSISVKIHNAPNYFVLYDLSETQTINGEHKKDSSVSHEDGVLVRKYTERHYDINGHLAGGNTQEETIDEEMESYVISEVSSFEHVNELITRIDSLVPGILDILYDINPHLKTIVNNINKKSYKLM